MEDSEKQSKELFQRATSQLKAPPFLAARVASELDARNRARAAVRTWKFAAVFGGAFSLALLIALVFAVSPGEFQARVGEETLVAVDVKSSSLVNIARLELVLPEGVSLVSDRYPELSDQRTIALSVHGASAGEIPFVVRSRDLGMKVLEVRLFDQAGKNLGKKTVKIRFS